MISRYYGMTFDPAEISTEDAQTVLNAIAESDYTGRQMVWNHLKTNWRYNPVPDW